MRSCVPGRLRPRPQSVFVQIVAGDPLFERQMQVHRAPRTHPRRAPRQRSRPLPPLLAVKLIEIFEGVLLAFAFARLHAIQQPGDDRIAPAFRRDAASRVSRAGIAQLLDPLRHHLHVAQLAERLEKLSSRLLHLLPGRIGIDRHQSIGQRTAAPQRNAKIVYRISIETDGRAVTLHRHSLHPGAQPKLRLRVRGLGVHRRGTGFQNRAGCQPWLL